jgi:hypothetical protein
MKPPERIELDLDQAEALLQRAKEALCAEDYNTVKAMVETIYLLSQSVDQKAASIRRLLKMLFGERSEKIEKVLQGTDRAASGKKPSENQDQPKGHGRRPADEYTGADKVDVCHPDLKAGDRCPGCLKGKVPENHL